MRWRRLGVEFKKDEVVGATETIDELMQNGYDAVFIGVGADCPISSMSPART